MESKLNLKKEAEFEKDKIYSICLRGARRFEKGLVIFTPAYQDSPKEAAVVISQNHYRFQDIEPSEYLDNYDVTAQSIMGLGESMSNAYPDFDGREIVTILRFKIIY